MKDIATIISQLRQPFPANRVDWKVQTAAGGEKALVVAYVDARDISERLNSVCPNQWSTKFTPIYQSEKINAVECSLTIRDGDTSSTRSDVGVGDHEDDRLGAGLKILWSDAIKRAAVHFGVNSCVYELPAIWMEGDGLYIKDGKVKGISGKGKKDLNDRYATWVASEPIVKRFGEIYS